MTTKREVHATFWAITNIYHRRDVSDRHYGTNVVFACDWSKLVEDYGGIYNHFYDKEAEALMGLLGNGRPSKLPTCQTCRVLMSHALDNPVTESLWNEE